MNDPETAIKVVQKWFDGHLSMKEKKIRDGVTSIAGMWAKMSDIGIGVAKDDDDNLVIVASMRVPNINLFNVKRH